VVEQVQDTFLEGSNECPPTRHEFVVPPLRHPSSWLVRSKAAHLDHREPRQRSVMKAFAIVSFLSTTAAFTARQSLKTPSALFSTETGLPIILNGQNIDLTPALVDHVNKRIGSPLEKLASNGAVTECDVVLSVNKNPKVKNSDRVEVITNLKGTTIICKHESPDMYNSIDAASKALSRKLRKYKDNRIAGWHGGKQMGDDLLAALEAVQEVELGENDSADEEFQDPGKPTVTKVNSFDLEKAVSVEEAVFALDYVDHDFYVFRNEESDKINVVYKRHTGGVGLIEPKDAKQ